MKLSQACADAGASILDVQHQRAWEWTGVDRVKLRVVLEVSGDSHWESVLANLRDSDYGVISVEVDHMY